MGGNVRQPGLVRQIIGEPFVHFLALGAAIFVWHGLAGDLRSASPSPIADRKITITSDQIRQLATQWATAWDREPSADEIDGLVRDFIREEVYYREALRLGLDRDDLVVRRRLRSKMEFLASAELENARPDEAVLRAWFEKNRDRYLPLTELSFDQVYLGGPGGRDISGNANELLGKLQAGADPSTLGEPAPIPSSFEQASASEIVRMFGADGLAALLVAPLGRWTGPVKSGIGLHLFHVRRITNDRQASFDDHRQQVENDWRAETLAEREERGYQSLLSAYSIHIERLK